LFISMSISLLTHELGWRAISALGPFVSITSSHPLLVGYFYFGPVDSLRLMKDRCDS
jgi:hypothetical protein